jgi:hypothetical protein
MCVLYLVDWTAVDLREGLGDKYAVRHNDKDLQGRTERTKG